MSIETFESWALTLGVSGLIAYMVFIVYDLGRQSQAGRFGMFVLFLALGLGVLGFAVKTVLVEVLAR
jgi:hypothetical protein